MIFQRTGGADFPDRLKVLLTGQPKSGKTTFLGTVPNIVIADTEPHANNLQSLAHLSIPYVTIRSSDDLMRLRVLLADPNMRAKAAADMGMPSIDAVAIDTLDTLQVILKKERLVDQHRTQFQRDDWGWLKEEMSAILLGFTALPLDVIFTVHHKTQELGVGDDMRSVVMPGLQGAIAEEIAGMVGYSLYAFRRGEVRPDGSPYTAYWLRAEGDETFGFVGNRAAGALPDIVEPDFAVLRRTALANRPAYAAPSVAVYVTDQGEPGEAPGPQDVTPAAEPVVEPMNAAAMGHVKKVYDSIGAPFPTAIVEAMNLPQARELVKMWQAAQSDALQNQHAEAAIPTMRDWLTAMGYLPDVATARPAPGATIEQLLSWVGHDQERAQAVLNDEVDRPRPRATLLNALRERGANETVPAAAPAEPPAAAPEPAPEPAVATPEPPAPAPITEEQMAAAKAAMDAVTPPMAVPVKAAPPEPAESGTPVDADAAQDAIINGLGGQIVTVLQAGSKAPCDICGNPIDDDDIAALSQARFKKWLCVADYVATNRAAH